MKRRLPLLLLTPVLVLLTAGCGKKHTAARIPAPPPPAPAASRAPAPATARASTTAPQTAPKGVPSPTPASGELYGYASWYGHPYHGRRTASGEVYDMNALTAAHKTLPLGTRVNVTNIDNGREVQVRINDRGPFIEGRIIDLSYSAAKAIAMIGPGLALVRLLLLDPEPVLDVAGDRYGVQVGAFREKKNAERLQEDLARRHTSVTLRQDGDLYHVLVGAEASEAAAQLLAQHLRQENLTGIVVPLR